ncbi:MAG: ABC transporter substrate-binding protein [Granulosicoccus sp.]|nr:ABC transporter substrate-binding protein [Granulosicoccus sp.]
MKRYLLVALVGLFSPTLLAAEAAVAYIHDWKWEGQAAPMLMALDEGYFAEEGLEVTMDMGKGSVHAIPKVASGEYQFGSADINSLIRYRDQNPDSELQAVYVVYNTPPFAVVGRRSQGVIGPGDLHGHVLGAPAKDGAFAQWASFVAASGIKADKVTVRDVGFPEREALLADGEVDAVTGFSFSSLISLKAKGVPESDISLMLMSDFGLELYGNVVIVNPAFAAEHPEKVRGFVRATTRGYLKTIANPANAIKHVMTRAENADEEVELSRLIMAIGHHIVTPEVRDHGIGTLQWDRLERSIEQIGQSYAYTQQPSASDIFDDTFLPGRESRELLKPEIINPDDVMTAEELAQ